MERSENKNRAVPRYQRPPDRLRGLLFAAGPHDDKSADEQR